MRAIPKAPLLPSSNIVVRRFGDVSSEKIRIYIFLDVLDEILFHAQYRKEPAATLLVGGYYEGPAGPYIEIQGFTEALYVQSARHFHRTLSRRINKIEERVEQGELPQRILGWTFGRPGSATEMNTEGLLLHNTFFNLPHQVHLSIDPTSEDFCVYKRPEPGQGLVSSGFNIIATQEALSHLIPQWDTPTPEVEVELDQAPPTSEPITPPVESDKTPAKSDQELGPKHGPHAFDGDEPELVLNGSSTPVRDTIDVGPPLGFSDDASDVLEEIGREVATALEVLGANTNERADEDGTDPTWDRPEQVEPSSRTTQSFQSHLELGEPEPLETGLEVGGVHTRITQEVPPLSTQPAAPAEGADILASVRQSLSDERQSLFDVPSLEVASDSMTAHGKPGSDQDLNLGDRVEGSSLESGRFRSIGLQKAEPYSLSASVIAASVAYESSPEAPIPGSETMRARPDFPDLEPELLDAAVKLVVTTRGSDWGFGEDFDTDALAAEIKANPDRALDVVERAVEELENVGDALRLSPGIGEFTTGEFEIDEGWFLDGDDIESAFDSVMSDGPKWVPFSSAPRTTQSQNRIDTRVVKSPADLDLRSRFQKLRARREELREETDAFVHENIDEK